MVDEGGAIVADWDAVRMSALHHALAADTDNDAVVRALIARYDPALASKRGSFAVDVAMHNPVLFAARAGRSVEILDALMEVDPPADINAVSSSGYTVLMQCAGIPNRAAQIRWLLDHGSDLNARNTSERMSTCCGYNRTAIFYAAIEANLKNLVALTVIAPGDPEATRYRPFDPDHTDDLGKTVRDYLEAHEDPESLEDLYKFQTALQLNGLWKTVASERDVQTIRRAIPALHLFSKCRDDGATALTIAAKSNTDPTALGMILFLAQPQFRRDGIPPFDAGAKDDNGMTALDYAERNPALRDTEVLAELRRLTHEAIERDENGLRAWITRIFGDGFLDRLTADELTERQLVLLTALREQPEFSAFLAELPATNRAYFADYFAWQLDEEFPQDLRGADRFVHTIMNDLARVRLIPEDDIAVWRRERERQFDLLLNPVRAELRRVLMERALPDGMIEAIMATFERRVVASKRWLTNPACAACDRPSSPEDLASMIAYRESQFEAITDQIDQHHPRLADRPESLQRLLKVAAATLQRQVATGYLNRIGWTAEVSEDDPRPGRPIALGPIDEDRTSHWRPSSRIIANGSMRVLDEPEVRLFLRYQPAPD